MCMYYVHIIYGDVDEDIKYTYICTYVSMELKLCHNINSYTYIQKDFIWLTKNNLIYNNDTMATVVINA